MGVMGHTFHIAEDRGPRTKELVNLIVFLVPTCFMWISPVAIDMIIEAHN